MMQLYPLIQVNHLPALAGAMESDMREVSMWQRPLHCRHCLQCLGSVKTFNFFEFWQTIIWGFVLQRTLEILCWGCDFLLLSCCFFQTFFQILSVSVLFVVSNVYRFSLLPIPPNLLQHLIFHIFRLTSVCCKLPQLKK